MINLQNYFNKIYVINLDQRQDRWDQFCRRADAAGITGYHRYRAVEGDKCPHPEWWRAGNGAWGCLMTHLRISQDASMDTLDNYLVFEDDVVFSEDFLSRLDNVVRALSGVTWDQLYLGGQHLYVETSPPWPFRDGIVRGLNINRTHAYAVNSRFFHKFQQHIIHAPDYIGAVGDNHIDHQLGILHQRKENTILGVHPWICGQAGGMSNILGKDKDEDWWQDEGWYK
jgi:GR25 family glycosyltransferase involved in LPS biosynthesis